MSYAHVHCGERITVARLARYVGMSPSHFAHRFREIAGVSPIQYLKQV